MVLKDSIKTDRERIYGPLPKTDRATLLAQTLLEIFSDETGYPIEILDLEMDLEADLGVGPNQQTAILQVLQGRFPDLPPLQLTELELAELRTFEQIAQYLDRQPIAQETDSPPIPSVQRYLVGLKTLPPPDFLEMQLRDPRVCLITDDGSTSPAAVAVALAEWGWRTVVLRFPSSVVPQTLPLVPEGVALVDTSEEHLKQQLAQIIREHGPIGALIHLHPANMNVVDEEVLLTQVFLLAKYLKAPLHKEVPGGRSCFLTVARLDGRLGLTGKTYTPLAGACFGLTKTLNQEWTPVFCRALDLSPELGPQQVVRCILNEFHDPDRLTVEVAYTPTKRSTLVCIPAPEPQPLEGPQAQEVFLVSGGGKGITAQCVVHLAQCYRSRFILLGRSPRSPEPIWSQGCLDEAELKRRILAQIQAAGGNPKPLAVQEMFRWIESGREIERTLQAIAQAGGQAEYVQANVMDPRLGALIAPAVARLGPITGLIHGAGELADQRIEQKTLQDFTRIFGVKVQGLNNLLTCASLSQLKNIILFSSTAGFYGHVGQADYAMANEVLNKTAYWLKHKLTTCRVLAINWGPWEGGMVTPQLHAQPKIALIPVATGVQMLQAELSADGPCQVVLGSPPPRPSAPHLEVPPKIRMRRVLDPAANPFLVDHQLAGQPVLPFTCAAAWVIHSCEQLCPGYTFFRYSDVRLLKGITFAESQAQEFILDLEAQPPQEEAVVFQATLWSLNEQGQKFYHYKGTVQLVRQLPEPPHYTDFDLSETHPLTGSNLYDQGILFHGPGLAGLERVLNLSPDKITVQCRLPALSDRVQGQFPVRTFNPYTTDVILHPVLVHIDHFSTAGGLPSRFPALEQFRPLPWDQSFYVSVEVRHRTPAQTVADVMAHDAAGKLYLRLQAGAFTSSSRLRELFAQTAAQRRSKPTPAKASRVAPRS
ncbi:SDR family NAD(P)-dependent oxidoreductase [Anthocerotibacter panamensis]|uniref:SDR family NAD(P)-dependent oxidoreductase n=1 Tax=Anthocerotibacter panamensis TaxID=2857077 RepID=UPI001C402ABC|nr:SDR family NAD(P)-dependent oxidoreductase [Anthocerotibacter panamensis]